MQAARWGSWAASYGEVGIAKVEEQMPPAEELRQKIESAIPGSRAAVEDLTGGGDHFRAEVVSERFAGLSLIEQHKLVYDVFGDELGGPIHALSIKTSTPETTK